MVTESPLVLFSGSSLSEFPRLSLSMSDPKLYLGIALALCSCVSSATGYTLQKVAHNKAAVSKAKAAASSPAHTPRQGSPSPKSTANGTPRNVDVNVWTPSGVRGPATGEGTGKEEDNRAEGKVGAPPFPPEHESRVAILPETEEVPAETDVEKAKGYKRFWQFYAGLVLLIVGTVFSAFVFGLAPQSTLAPLGSVTMIVNAILS